MSPRSLIGLASVACLAVQAVAPARAQEKSFVVNPLFAAGLTYGGDSIASYNVNWGDVDAGGTLYYYGGVNLEWPNRHVALVVQGGRFVTSVSDYRFERLGMFERWPVEVIALFERGRLRGGIGAARHLSPTFSDDSGSGLKLRFADTTGTLIQFQYLYPRFSIDARYVIVDYKLPTAELSGNHLGGGFTWRFGRSKTLEAGSQ